MSTERHYRRKYLLVAGLLLLGVGAWGGIALYNRVPHYNNLDDVRRATNLVIVLPSALPRDTIITDHPTYEEKTGSIMTRMTVSGKSVTFSQQKRPEADLKQIDTEDTFLVNAGSVYALKGEAGRLQAIVETSDSWIMVNADAKLGVSVFKELLETLDTI